MRTLRVGFILILSGAVSGCAASRLQRTLTPPEKTATLDARSPYLKAHMKDGQLYVLADWRVDEAAGVVSGRGDRLGVGRGIVETGGFDLPIEKVALFETNVVQSSPSVNALAVVAGISAAVTAYCLANTKACFGSCPTFYVSDGQAPVLQAEGFSASVSPSLEASDRDALFRARPRGRRVTVTMTNEALETHVVRSVRLLAAPRPKGGRVLATPAGPLLEATDLRALDSCFGHEGDCGERVRAFDGREYFTAADAEDLARREVMALGLPAADGPRGLVIAFRQTLASTYLFYQSLAWLGRSATARLAALERGDPAARGAIEGLGRAIGGIEVSVETGAGEWVSAGEVREMGPLATDVVVVPLPRDATGRVHLRLARGHWRIDWLASARLGRRVEPRVLDPASARGEPRRPVRPDGTIVTLPGDVWTLAFELPGDPDGHELFLESRGYYLEWLREEWLAEENPGRAAELLLDPEEALRRLAPEFKEQEARMEDAFWGSRYARP